MSGVEADGGPGERFAAALAAKDADAMLGVLAPDVDFRGLTPGRFWAATSARQLVDEVFAQWFEADDAIEAVESVASGAVADRRRVSYTFRVRNPSGTHLVEQHAYYEADGGRITWLRVMCSGFRPVDTAAP